MTTLLKEKTMFALIAVIVISVVAAIVFVVNAILDDEPII
jgi:hypothetical protein